MTVYWPTGSTRRPQISDRYGKRTPIQTVEGTTLAFHYGVDIPGAEDTVWKSPARGTVIYSGLHPTNSALGYVVVIEDRIRGDRVQFVVPHLNPAKPMREPGPVRARAVIGTCGLSGQTTGYHTCFRIFVNGDWRANRGSVNPVTYMRAVNVPPPSSKEHTMNLYRVVDPKTKKATDYSFDGYTLQPVDGDRKMLRRALPGVRRYKKISPEQKAALIEQGAKHLAAVHG